LCTSFKHKPVEKELVEKAIKGEPSAVKSLFSMATHVEEQSRLLELIDKSQKPEVWEIQNESFVKLIGVFISHADDSAIKEFLDYMAKNKSFDSLQGKEQLFKKKLLLYENKLIFDDEAMRSLMKILDLSATSKHYELFNALSAFFENEQTKKLLRSL